MWFQDINLIANLRICPDITQYSTLTTKQLYDKLSFFYSPLFCWGMSDWVYSQALVNHHTGWFSKKHFIFTAHIFLYRTPECCYLPFCQPSCFFSTPARLQGPFSSQRLNTQAASSSCFHQQVLPVLLNHTDSQHPHHLCVSPPPWKVKVTQTAVFKNLQHHVICHRPIRKATWN